MPDNNLKKRKLSQYNSVNNQLTSYEKLVIFSRHTKQSNENNFSTIVSPAIHNKSNEQWVWNTGKTTFFTSLKPTSHFENENLILPPIREQALDNKTHPEKQARLPSIYNTLMNNLDSVKKTIDFQYRQPINTPMPIQLDNNQKTLNQTPKESISQSIPPQSISDMHQTILPPTIIEDINNLKEYSNAHVTFKRR